ncbi:MAG TPA: hypothetical protein VKG26_08170, partial [Bacteroidia bacterium]|nr:hypothetical protein [Bacteroidia bacterium]
IASGNLAVIQEFIEYQIRLFKTHDSGHEGFRLYHFVVLLIGCFPASVFFIPSHTKNPSDTPFQVYVKKWMLALFWVVLIIFTLVNTKIVHYSSMCYFPLTYLAAYKLHDIIYSRKKLNSIVFSLGLFLIIVLGIAFTAAGLINYFVPTIANSNLIDDKFAVASLLTPVKWYGFEWIVGVLFLVFSIYFFINLHKNKKYMYGLFTTSLLTIWLITLLIVPKVEPYSQGPAIEFYESLKGKDCYVETIGFKSYAYLFYTDRQPAHNSPDMLTYIKSEKERVAKTNGEDYDFSLFSLNWMLFKTIDKPAYLAAKVTEIENIRKYHPDLIELYQKGGFVFYKRLPLPNNH